MSRSPSPWPIAGLFAAALAGSIGACTPPPPPTAQSRAAQATANACRQRADEVFARQNRASFYTQNAQDSPESGAYVSGITTRGLADRFNWDRQVSDCVAQSTGGGAATSSFSPSPSPVRGSGTSLGPAR